jgi:putative SOS response-associated peptidase YedK
MCGRFTLTLDAGELQEQLGIDAVPTDYRARFNIAPTQVVYAITGFPYQLQPLRWGLIPFWAKDPSISVRMINARAETLMEKPAFRTSFQKRRCLIPASGFFEWEKFEDKKPSQPYYFRLQSGGTFFFAGLWDSWHSEEGAEIKSCTIITTTPNELLNPIHDRMPVMINRSLAENWLKENDPRFLKTMLVPYLADQMEMYPVSRLVNRPGIDQPECIQPQK